MEYNLDEYPKNKHNFYEEGYFKQGKGFWNGLFAGILLTLLIISSVYTMKQFYKLNELKKENAAVQTGEDVEKKLVSEETIGKLQVIEDTINDFYYQEDIQPGELIDGMYEGIVASLGDPYSAYYSKEDLLQLMEQTEGIYYGIGAYVGMDAKTGLASISSVIPNTPAEAAGIRAGDIIYMVDGESAQGLELSEVVGRIKGLEGTKVTVTMVREGESDYLEFNVERKKIESPTVNYEMYEDGIGYIQITEFDDITVGQFTEAMSMLHQQDMKGLILDLRANPGGNLNSVVEIAQQLLPEGLIVYTEDREGNRAEYSCDGTKEFKLPLVVLVNGYSASAAEILAGAVKDYGIGELVGTTTYGKGIVQKVISLSDDTALKLTVSTYFTPNGKNIHGIGIEPDQIYEFDGERYYNDGYDNQLEYAKEVAAKKIGTPDR